MSVDCKDTWDSPVLCWTCRFSGSEDRGERRCRDAGGEEEEEERLRPLYRAAEVSPHRGLVSAAPSPPRLSCLRSCIRIVIFLVVRAVWITHELHVVLRLSAAFCISFMLLFVFQLRFVFSSECRLRLPCLLLITPSPLNGRLSSIGTSFTLQTGVCTVSTYTCMCGGTCRRVLNTLARKAACVHGCVSRMERGIEIYRRSFSAFIHSLEKCVASSQGAEEREKNTGLGRAAGRRPPCFLDSGEELQFPLSSGP